MGIMAKVLSTLKTRRGSADYNQIKVNSGAGVNLRGEQFSGAGDDSIPLPGDYAVTVEIPRQGGVAIVGFVDPGNASAVNPGEKRSYSRSSDGTIVAQVYLKNDGSVIIDNDNGSITLDAGGDITLNGVTIDASGNVTVPTSINLAGKELNGHNHAILSGSSAPGPTGPNN